MTKIVTLRNIITLTIALFFAACNNFTKPTAYSASSELKSISSEDKYANVSPLAEMTDPESGQTIYFVSKK